jgi:hypothetical protein
MNGARDSVEPFTAMGNEFILDGSGHEISCARRDGGQDIDDLEVCPTTRRNFNTLCKCRMIDRGRVDVHEYP